jgi:hypothetical protein
MSRATDKLTPADGASVTRALDAIVRDTTLAIAEAAMEFATRIDASREGRHLGGSAALRAFAETLARGLVEAQAQGRASTRKRGAG